MKNLTAVRQFALAILVVGAVTPAFCGQVPDSHILRATAYDSHFPATAKPGESFNGIGVSSSGTIYYVISSDKYNIPGQMYSFNPKTKAITHIDDLNDAVGQGKIKAVAQGKSHVNFVEASGKLYFSTHLGYYNNAGGVERTAAAPHGYLPYPGGHFLSYDLRTGKFTNLAIAPGGQGIIAMNMDVQRDRLYGITWPYGNFLRYDLKTGKLKEFKTTFHGGELGKIGSTYRAICRRIVVDPEDGSAYFTTGDGTIHRYDYRTDELSAVAGVNLKKDYFGQYNPAMHGMAYNWRAAIWVPSEHAIYGVNGRSGYLFRFDPRVPSVKVLERLTSGPAKKTGTFDPTEYGYLGLALGTDGHTLYYLTGAPLAGSKEGMKADPDRNEGTHLITYDVSNGKYVDHGQILLNDGSSIRPPQSLVIGLDGTLYTLPYVVRNGKEGIDLISFHP
ncbi:MAG TPA: hypothetical protein VFN62_06625 [Acidobacteriaceae bacterium]|nr:hypothetical protein [Acidobacteriaceae bacterium]